MREVMGRENDEGQRGRELMGSVLRE